MHNLLKKHIDNTNPNDYLFSVKDFKPGVKQVTPKKISDNWVKFRTLKKIPIQYQLYSLKDTGITDLLISGVPAIKVRDQARHHDLKITESYTPRNKVADDFVRNSKVVF